MPLTPAQITALGTELTTDPRGYGYAAATSDAAKADLVNLRRAAIRLRRADIASREIIEAVEVGDYTALPGSPTAAQLSTERRYLAWFQALASIPVVRLLNPDGTDGPAIVNLKAMFGAGTGTRTRLAALAERDGSRAEELFGAGIVVTHLEVAAALGRSG